MVYNNCHCDNLPEWKPTGFIVPTGSFREFICHCPRLTKEQMLKPASDWYEYMEGKGVICLRCNKPKSHIKRCRLCNEDYIYIGSPFLCGHHPHICRSCIRDGSYSRCTGNGDPRVLSAANADSGLFYKKNNAYRSVSIEDLLEGL